LTEDRPGLSEIWKTNRRYVYAILMMPVAGMLIATGLIIIKKPSNMILALGVIFFLMVQYGFTIYFFMQRLNTISKKNEQEKFQNN
jgi:hypothetical protein